jgi:hypothetical protein
MMAQSKGLNEGKKVSLGQRWNEAQPTKTMAFWLVVASIILTMIIGFNWGGWVTGSTAQRAATAAANTAVTERLTSICVGQFNLDPAKSQKLTELNAARSSQRTAYVRDQGWATMPGEEKADSKVADACSKLIVEANP